MADGHGRYRGTIALDVGVPGAVPGVWLLALDARERGVTLRGVRAPGGARGAGMMPNWVADADTGSRHRQHGGGASGQADGSVTWAVGLVPAPSDVTRSLRLTPGPPPHPHALDDPSGTPDTPGGPVEVALPGWPPRLHTVTATVSPTTRVVRSPLADRLHEVVGHAGATRPERVVALSARLDAGRRLDPAVLSIEVWPTSFDLHVTWDSYVPFEYLGGSGWTANDDAGGRYDGVVRRTANSRTHDLHLAYTPALAPGARSLTVTLPDPTTTALTRAGALRATLPLPPIPP